MSRWLGFGLMLSLCLVCPALWAAQSTLESVRISQHGHTTTVRFDLDHVPKYHFFSLDHPARAVIDFDDTHSAGVDDVSQGAVRDIRVARHSNGRLRAVLDLADGAALGQVSVSGSDVIATIKSGDSSAYDSASHAQAHERARQGQRTAATSTRTSRGKPKARYRATAENGTIVVVIDPGHGGHDSGTRAASGLEEKTVVLGVAKYLYAKFKATRRIHPVLTRDSDTYVTLRQRVRIAQKHHANLFISIHGNAYPNDPSVKGGTCYMLSKHGATDAKAAQLAHFENTRDRSLAGVKFSADPTLNAVLTDLYQNASIEHADDVARDIIARLARIEPIYRHKPPRANFAVLRDPMIPSVLCETAFLSNPHQARKLAGNHFRKQLADAIFRGVMTYFRKHPPERIQPVGGMVYTVHSGDTLSEIAARQDVSVKALMDINHLHSKTLKVGQKLQLPGG